jgi:hypothetical protein
LLIGNTIRLARLTDGSLAFAFAIPRLVFLLCFVVGEASSNASGDIREEREPIANIVAVGRLVQ